MQLFDLSGSVALVTGGNGGIGRGIAEGLAAAGASVVIAARDAEKTAAAVAAIEAAGGRALGLRCDVMSGDDIIATVAAARDAFGPVDILVNNSGISRRGLPEELGEDDWDAVMDTNIKAAYRFCKAVHPQMRERGRGKVINVASNYSIFGGTYNFAYSTSKGAMLQFTRSLANGWAKDNIQVNAILPGYIVTGLTERITEGSEIYNLLIGRIPAGRPALPDELAGTGVFLASRASDYVTGIAISVDGGMAVADVAVQHPLEVTP